VSAESPDERAEPADPTDSESTVNEAAGEAEASGDDGEQDRSYEQRVLDELVPEISVGDGDPADDNGDSDGGDAHDDADEIPGPIDAEPGTETTIDEGGGLADALGELDEELQQAFLRIVVGIKVGILLISAGILAIGFQGMTTLGGGLIAVGTLAVARAGHQYWAYEQASDDSHNG